MKESYKNKIVSLLKIITFCIVAGLISYLLVDIYSFLPNGYDVVSQTEEEVIVRSFDLRGMEAETFIFSPLEHERWITIELLYQIDQHQGLYTFAFFVMFTSIFLFVRQVKQGNKLIGTFFSLALSILSISLALVFNVTRIKDLLGYLQLY